MTIRVPASAPVARRPPAKFPLPRAAQLLGQYHAECEAVAHGIRMAANNARWYAKMTEQATIRSRQAARMRDALQSTFAWSVANACAACAERQALLAAEQCAEVREFNSQAIKSAAALTLEDAERTGSLQPLAILEVCRTTVQSAEAAAAQAKADAEKAVVLVGRRADSADIEPPPGWAEAIAARREDP